MFFTTVQNKLTSNTTPGLGHLVLALPNSIYYSLSTIHHAHPLSKMYFFPCDWSISNSVFWIFYGSSIETEIQLSTYNFQPDTQYFTSMFQVLQ
jgi:hypothetical protein